MMNIILGLIVDKSYLYYQQSSEAGNKYASYTLGILYKKGFGIEQDFNKSFYYFQKTYEQGNIYALNQLAMFYKYGLGVDQNITKTIDYYEKILNACKSLKYNELFAVKCIANHTVKAYEYDALSKLHHPHIIFLYELFEEQDSQYLVMDYCPNDTLRQKGKLDYNQFLIYAKQILEARSVCHSKMIAHRDIKPEKI